MPLVTLVTGHYLLSRRRAGFHWLADAYYRMGWRVLFLCGAISYLSIPRRDHRLHYPVWRQAGQLIEVAPNLYSFVWWTPYHAVNLRNRLVNHLVLPLFRRYGRQALGAAEPLVRQSDLVIVESSPALMLTDQLRRLAPAARFVYRVSDDLDVLKSHRAVIEAEARLAGGFDRISVPAPRLARRFAHLPQTTIDPHGLARHLFDQPHANPYPGPFAKNALFIGVSRLDTSFIAIAARRFPQVGFHLIGDLPAPARRANIIAHGEMAFEETIAYLQHADVGLHCLTVGPGVEVFARSLKVVQYRYCGLPVVTPQPLVQGREGFFGYRPGDAESIAKALEAALATPRHRAPDDAGPPSWDHLAQSLAAGLA
ncbi:MAG: hypothetical protein WD042_19485 [Phycisphaeraceae bacterium]